MGEVAAVVAAAALRNVPVLTPLPDGRSFTVVEVCGWRSIGGRGSRGTGECGGRLCDSSIGENEGGGKGEGCNGE